MDEVEIEKKPQLNFSYIVKAPLIGLAIASLALVLLLLLSSPESGPVVVITFLLTVMIFSVSLNIILIQFLLKILKQKNFTGVRLFYTSAMIAIGLTFIIGLQTLNQLQFVDLVLVILFELVIFFYMSRRFR